MPPSPENQGPFSNKIASSSVMTSASTDNDKNIIFKLGKFSINGKTGGCAPLTALAYEITSESWSELGMQSSTNDIDIITERIVALFLIRIIAILSTRKNLPTAPCSSSPVNRNGHTPSCNGRDDCGANFNFHYNDLSTTTICQTAMRENLPEESWDTLITKDVITKLRTYIKTICEGYRSVPYHNVEHAYHVVISANKLLDMMLCNDDDKNNPRRFRPSYGIRADPLSQFAFIYSALVHDVDHQGVTNRQLVYESDELAILYNDQSVAEQRSLAVAFSELMKPEFEPLRKLIFPMREEFARFRKLVINLVLSTDIASPERVQVVKSKWKEAFGHAIESKERKMKAALKRAASKRRSSLLSGSQYSGLPSQKEEEEMPPQNLSIPTTSRSNSKVHDSINSEDWKDQLMPEDIADPKKNSLLAQFFDGRGSMMDLGYDPASHSSTEKDSSGVGYESDENSSYLSISPTSSYSDLNSSLRSFQNFKVDCDDGVIKSGVTSSARTFMNSSAASIEETPVATTETCPEENEIEAVSSCDDKNETDEVAESPAERKHSILMPLKFERKNSDNSTAGKRRGSGVSLLLEDIEEDFKRSKEKMEKKVSRGTAGRKGSVLYHYSTNEINREEQFDRRKRMMRRLSAPNLTKPKSNEFRRLGIRRALDFTGDAIEAFKNNTSFQTHLTQDSGIMNDLDEPDELKASVVLEQMLKAADVGALLQGFDEIRKWSTRLFIELKSCHVEGRGDDPSPNWYQGQILFMENYALPLARNLADTGVFRDDVWPMFEQNVKNNIALWLEEGLGITSRMIHDWENGRLDGNRV